jgi:lysophospholipase L1-like esterase
MAVKYLIFAFFLCSKTLVCGQDEGYEFVNPPITIVVLGSSTAEGIGTKPRDSSWVNRFRVYVQTFNPENQVINLGKGGFSTYEIMPTLSVTPRNRPLPDTLRNIDKALSYRPDGIIINMPSNDVGNGYPIEEQLANFRRLASILDSNGVELYVTTSQPRNFPKKNDRLTQHQVYDSLRTIFYTNYIDFYTGFADAEDQIASEFNSGDGVHMNNGAHRILLDRVIESQAFAGKLDKTAYLRLKDATLREKKSPFVFMVGFDGIISPDSTVQSAASTVKIFQNDRLLSITETDETNYYLIEVKVDSRMPVQVAFSAPNVLTKVITIDFEAEKIAEDLEGDVFYPLEALDIGETTLELFSIIPADSSLEVARFYFEETDTSLSLAPDVVYGIQQRDRLLDYMYASEQKKQVNYWPDGTKKSVLKFKNGLLNGKSTWYDLNGNKQRVVYFLDGYYHGKFISYDPNGEKAVLRMFENDVQVGEAVVY